MSDLKLLVIVEDDKAPLIEFDGMWSPQFLERMIPKLRRGLQQHKRELLKEDIKQKQLLKEQENGGCDKPKQSKR